ncbi:MAG: ABC transporter permease, partial [Armatimonadota bacterium]
ASFEQVERLRHQMGLDRPWPVRYVEFVGKAVRLDFGESYYGMREPVGKIILRALPMTLRLALYSVILATLVGVTLGTLAGVFRDRWIDRMVLTLSTLGVTMPNFVLAPLLVYIFAVQLDRLPTTWEVNLKGPEFLYLILPVTVLSARTTATITRLTRASMIDTLGMEFIRLAVAKGVPPFRVVVFHGLRNAILPVLTTIGTSLGFLLTGSFVVETIFTMPGMGYAAIDAILKKDSPVILATTLVAGALFVLINLVVDLILPLVDPRIRESQV